jgi:cathepsin A (carboxypeptidase C)
LDEVTNLPGLSWKPNFRQYSGYLKATGNKLLHYWFVESQGNPKTDPVVLWMNGGPGCSSLDGFLSEHGPFLIADDGQTLQNNLYSWNKVANMLYLEAPAGVGYSYSSDGNYTTNDDETSLNNYVALQYFMNQFSEYSKNSFFITGESYGGIYVPTLSVRVAEDKSFNFKGFAVGNGLSDSRMNDDSLVYFAYYHGLIGDKLWLALVQNCCNGGNSTLGNCKFSSDATSSCSDLVSQVQQALSDLNIYNLYDQCYQSSSAQKAVIHPHDLFLFGGRFNLQKILASKLNVSLVPPCINATAIGNYLNQQSVRKALHIPDSLPPWQICSVIDYHPQYNSMKNQYNNILSLQKQHILVYNGDVDMACNYLGDQWFVNSLGRKIISERSAWYYTALDGSKQVAGFMEMYANITFATIKGAGHMVPQNKPIQSLEMFSNFLSGVF